MLWLAALPNVPDITQPHILREVGSQVLMVGLVLMGLTVGFGITIALINWSMAGSFGDRDYGKVLRLLPHTLVVMVLVWVTYLGGSTLAVRYHDWEQARLATLVQDVSGDRLEQKVPRLRYEVKVPFRYTTYSDGKPVQVEEIQEEYRYLYPVESQLYADIQQNRDATQRRFAYTVAFQGAYRFTNTLATTQSFDVEISLPSGYTVAQGVAVTRDGKSQPLPGEPRAPVILTPGETTLVTLTNTTQGGSRWVYDTEGQLLTQFRLTIAARFANPQFASGVLPTRIAPNTLIQPESLPSQTLLTLDTPLTTTPAPGVTTYQWDYQDNVAVRDPFGVFTQTEGIEKIGIMPRLLLLSPGILVGWLGLIYLTGIPPLKNTILLGGSFGTSLVLLTYLSRLNLNLAFAIFAVVLIALVSGIEQNPRSRTARVITTLCGVLLPTLAFLVPYTGIILAIAAVLSMGWLVVKTHLHPAPPEI